MTDISHKYTFDLSVGFDQANSNFQSFFKDSERVANGLYRAAKVPCGLGTWTEDTYSLTKNGNHTKVTCERTWHKPIILGDIVSPAMKLGWKSTFKTYLHNFEKYLRGLERGIC